MTGRARPLRRPQNKRYAILGSLPNNWPGKMNDGMPRLTAAPCLLDKTYPTLGLSCSEPMQ